MPTLIDEEIDVEFIDDIPHVFWWQRFAYRVVDAPQLFYRRKAPWWTGERWSMQRVDDEFWRVAAVRDGAEGEPELYDLRNDGLRWTLALRS